MVGRPRNRSSRSIESIVGCMSRVESMNRSKVESIDRVDRALVKSSQPKKSSKVDFKTVFNDFSAIAARNKNTEKTATVTNS